MDKSPDAFRTISEVADDLEIPQHVLRFWETRFHDIKPMKRGGGRRYYRPDDVALLRGIRHLLYGEGYTIRGVQRILREQNVRFVQNVWRPGAPQPAHGPAEDGAADADMPAEEKGRGLLGFLPSLRRDEEAAEPPRREPRSDEEEEPEDDEVPVATRPGPARREVMSVARDDFRKLHAAVHELGECRKLLDAAIEETP